MTTNELQTFLKKQQEKYPIPAYKEAAWVIALTWVAILLPLAIAILCLITISL